MGKHTTAKANEIIIIILNKCHASKKLAMKPQGVLYLNPSFGLLLMYLFSQLTAGFQY